MKQVTIENVKKRILELERAGHQGLSISLNEERELDCLRQLVAVTEQLHAVVAENVAPAGLQAWFDSNMTSNDGQNGFLTQAEALEKLRQRAPATAAAIAALRAEGIEQWIASRNGAWNGTTKQAEEYAAQLRQSVQVKGVQS